MIKNKIVFILIINSLFINACNNSYDWESKYQHLKGKNIGSLTSISPFNKVSEIRPIDENKDILLIIFDCICATCATTLIEWGEFVQKEKIEEKYNFIMLINNTTHSYVKNIIKTKNIIAFPVFIDNKEGILRKKNVSLMMNDDTILIDSQGNIKFIGNILTNENHRKELYSII